ncbi:uncharacterized protein LOC116609777 isoform X2 [Nematostella vectensis]|uniref:uncharacterized protein LOC116609777 isoform X2 n=1 Tax=Nematostella vectensis TaxID=45351 RepID=UPI0020778BDA|nr:uncharacterized protein LOC116609777 isoform X2 [Nematostella vectensis]
MDDFEEDIFDRNIDQLDVRETPRWELSEEEDSGGCEVDNLMNQKTNRKQNPAEDEQVENTKLSQVATSTNLPVQNPGVPSVGPKGPERPIPVSLTNGAPQSPLLTRAPSGPHSCASTTESVKTVMSPLYARKMDKAKIDALVQAAYAKDEDSIKDFGAAERCKQSSQSQSKPIKPVAPSNTMKKLTPWEDDDADSIKDFSGTDRKKEEKYMERTDEAIYQRASEEHIKRPPIWHDEEVDSLRDFGRISGKQEMPSGMTSQQISRVPSDEELCLSPPWNDEDDGPVRNFVCTAPDHKNYGINKMVTEEQMRQIPPWHDDDMDSTRDYAEFCKMASIENSRRPSEENIYLTPPWMEDDRSSCAQIFKSPPQSNTASTAHMTLEEKRAIEEEAKNSGLNAGADKAQAFRKEKTQEGTTGAQLPGRDSGFCSEQDQHAQQAPATTVIADSETEKDFPSTNELLEELPEVPSPQSIPVPRSAPVAFSTTAPMCSGMPQYVMPVTAPASSSLNPVYVHNTSNRPVMTTVAAVNPVVRSTTQEVPPPLHLMTRQQMLQLLTQQQQQQPPSQIPDSGKRIGVVRQGSGDIGLVTSSHMVRQQNPEVTPTTTTVPQDKEMIPHSVPQSRATQQALADDTRMMYNMACAAKGLARSASHSSMEANCYSPHDALEGFETSSVVSFASTAATHQDLDTRIDMMQSLLSLLGTHDKDDMSRTLLAMSNSKDSCAAMRQSGCLPLLIDLLHGRDNPKSRRDARARAGLALHNIVYTNVEDRRGRREIRVLRLLEIVRAHCDVVHYGDMPPHPCAERWYPPLRDYGPGPAVAALMKLSFEEEHRTAICELGGLHAIAELIEIDHKVNAECKDFYSISLRKYAGMTLTNLTFGNTKNKTILCKMDKTLEALIAQLGTTEEEEIVQVSASILRNLSWRADDVCREALKSCNATRSLIDVASKVTGETALRTILSALWNLSAHCSENKTELCSSPGALKFIVKCLSYCSPSGNISVVESSGGILRNLSSHIAVRSEYRKVLRANACFHTLLSHLRSPSLRVVSNACGALWNLSARCPEDQELLWELGAVSLLKSLANSKHKAIATASSAALRNLMAVKPTSSHATDNESVSSRQARRYRSMPAGTRTQEAQSKLRQSARDRVKSPGTQSPRMQQSPQARSPHTHSPRSESPVVQREDARVMDNQDTESVASIANSNSSTGSARAARESKGGALAMNGKPRQKGDSSSIGSGASMEGRHNHLGRWSGSNDSLSRHRKNMDLSHARPQQTGQDGHARPQQTGQDGHSRSSSDGGAVIQLVTDSYPLQVTAKTSLCKGQESRQEGATSRVRQALGYTGSQPSVLSGRQSDTGSVVSPGTARRLNQWAEIQVSESIEMSSMSARMRPESRITQNAPAVAASRESVNSSRQRRRRVQKFRSYRDTDSDPEADIDSDDDRTMFSTRGNTGNAWVKKNGNRNAFRGHMTENGIQSPRMQTKMAEDRCVCTEVSNVWIKRGKSADALPKRMCEKCNKEKQEGNGITAVKTRRNSSDSPLSSPSAMRVPRVISDPEDAELEASKRGVRVTSL